MEDNARKFIVERISPDFLTQKKAVSFFLVVDWLVTQDATEKKIVFKKFDSEEIQLIIVEKVISKDGRKTNKTKLEQTEYDQLLQSSIVHLEKTRYEYDSVIEGVAYSFKYDEFANGNLYMLEVDAKTPEERDRFDSKFFDPKLTEVTGDLRYYGYRIVDKI